MQQSGGHVGMNIRSIKHWLPVRCRFEFKLARLMLNTLHRLTSSYLSCQLDYDIGRRLRPVHTTHVHGCQKRQPWTRLSFYVYFYVVQCFFQHGFARMQYVPVCYAVIPLTVPILRCATCWQLCCTLGFCWRNIFVRLMFGWVTIYL